MVIENIKDYQALRVVPELQNRAAVPPPFANLALAAGMAVTNVFVHQALRDGRGHPVAPIPATLISRHDPSAPFVYNIAGLRLLHPARRAIVPSQFWLFRQRQLAHAAWKDPEEIAVAAAEGLRRVFTDTVFWDSKRLKFRSGRRAVEYGALVVDAVDANIAQPPLPVTAVGIANYAASLGEHVLLKATGAKELGAVHLSRKDYPFVPRSQALRPQSRT